MAYTTLEAVAARSKQKPAAANTDRFNAVAPGAIAAAQAWIDSWCGRTFEPVTEARMFGGVSGPALRIGDVATVTLLQTRPAHGEPWTDLAEDVDWVLGEPPKLGHPSDSVVLLPGAPPWPRQRYPAKTVRVEGQWGWHTVPAQVEEAAELMAVHLVGLYSGAWRTGQTVEAEAFPAAGAGAAVGDIVRLLTPYRLRAR